MMEMIETIINTPKVLTDNAAAITYDGISELSRCTPCCNGGWLSYQNGSPLFKILGNNYTGRYKANWSGTISSATAGVVAIGLFQDGVLIPDTVRAVTIAAADDYETISFDKKLRVCPRGTTNISVQSVPSVPTPTTPATPISTTQAIITNATFSISRLNR
jgi:hypothetical protein